MRFAACMSPPLAQSGLPQLASRNQISGPYYGGLRGSVTIGWILPMLSVGYHSCLLRSRQNGAGSGNGLTRRCREGLQLKLPTFCRFARQKGM